MDYTIFLIKKKASVELSKSSFHVPRGMKFLFSNNNNPQDEVIV